MFVFHSKYFCRSTLIKCHTVNFGVLNPFLTVLNFCFLKIAKSIKFQFYFCRILHLKRSTNSMHIPLLQQVLKVFPWGPWEGIVSAALAQANNFIEYCI